MLTKEEEKIIEQYNKRKISYQDLIHKIKIDKRLRLRKEGIIKNLKMEELGKDERKIIEQYNKKEIYYWDLTEKINFKRRSELKENSLLNFWDDKENFELRKELFKKELVPTARCNFGGKIHTELRYKYTDKQKEKIKNIPLNEIKKVLTDKEFERVKREVINSKD